MADASTLQTLLSTATDTAAAIGAPSRKSLSHGELRALIARTVAREDLVAYVEALLADGWRLALVAAHYDAYRDINQALWDAVHAGELTPGDVHVSRFEQWVATNAPADVQRPRIDRLGIEDLFDAITIST